MGDIGPEKLLLLLLVVLLLFGAKRLPEIGHSLGKGIREFKRSVSDLGSSVREEIPPAPVAQRPGDAPAPPVGQPERQPEERQPEREPKRLMP
ncbi:MAG: twin-arginine translocase TatA/TatE family subunit [Gemmatimonadaceae bacterium]